MRSIDRIEPFMNNLAVLWKERCPDWRFGQLISNLEAFVGHDLFYLEDEEMAKIIEDYFGKKSNKM